MRAFPTSWCAFDFALQEQELAELEPRSTQVDFWDDNRAAQAVMARISALHEQTDAWRDLAHQIDELWEMFELAEAEGDEELAGAVDKRRAELDTCIDYCEFELALRGPYDDRDAILAIHAGAGGTESQDWARDAAAHVPALGRAHRLQRPSCSTEAGRRSRHQERDGRDQRRVRLRLPEARARRAPPGAHVAVRLGARAATPRSRWSR